MMLAPWVFVSLLVVIKKRFPVGRKIDVFHRHGREHYRTTAFRAYLIHLWELSRSELHVVCRWQNICLEKNMSVVLESDRSLVPGVSSQSGRDSSVLVHHVDVHASHAIGSKGELLAVRTPHRFGVVSRIGCNLLGSSTGNRNRIDIPFE